MKYPAYPEYKESGVEWMGVIPAHWSNKRLKYVANRADTKVEADEERPLPYIGLEQIEPWTGRIIDLDDELVPSGVANRFVAGDTLFGKLRPYLAKACNVDFDGLCSSELLVLRGKAYDRQFLLYQILSVGFVDLIDSSTYGSKMPRASWDFIGVCELPIPPVEEQQAIARFLDAKTAQLDELIAKKRELIEKLKEKRSALIARTVTQGLPPEAAQAAGLDPHPKMKDSGVEWLGQIPEHWKLVPYKRVCTRVDVGIAEAATHAYCDDGVPMIRSTNIKSTGIEESDLLYIEDWFAQKNRSKILRAGDLVTVRTGYAGVTAVVPPSLDGCQCFTLVASTVKEYVIPEYVALFVNSIGMEYFELEAWGSAQANISVPIVQYLPIVIPSSGEQNAILTYLSSENAKIDAVLASCSNAISSLTEYRQALITAAVTGKIDVREAA